MRYHFNARLSVCHIFNVHILLRLLLHPLLQHTVSMFELRKEGPHTRQSCVQFVVCVCVCDVHANNQHICYNSHQLKVNDKSANAVQLL